ncbi:MAG: MotA/TolQ/ExbB proton channel family protein [Saccharospirillaceae bacterium]|nr:MotA/TolQ/ExbB proton channel family protein [Pseudomonadales bacterium]NRB77900.1 MotA/TolQ/ExbB proton channel family protein [Saccharospirillaceae bacterium]
MFEILSQGGLIMIPIIICSILSIAIIAERYWALRQSAVQPKETLPQVWLLIKNNQLDGAKLKELKKESAFGQILSAGITASKHGREAMKDAIVESGTHVAHELERFLSLLGTIVAITPLIGLLGTVIGMIEVFGQLVIVGAGDATPLAGGIQKALITTAAGLSVAIPALIFHRALQRKVDDLLISMEQASTKLVDAIHTEKDE